MNVRKPTLFPLLVGGIAFLLYALTHVRGYMPGESAFAVNQALPESMFPTFRHTMWHGVVRGLSWIPVGAFSMWLGVFSALCGGVSAAAVCGMALRLPLGGTPEEEGSPAPPRRIRAVVTGTAVLMFVFSPPIWFSATRPFPQMFGLMLLLLMGWWTVATFQKRSAWMLQVAAVFWGLLVTEYATAWFFVPLFGLMVLLTGFTLEGKFRWMRNLRIAGLFFVGVFAGYLLMTLSVMGHRHANFHQVQSMSGALLNSLRVQRDLLMEAAPARGSLLILILYGGPFMVAMFPKMHGTFEARIGSILLHAACVVANGVLLFHPSFSPWGMYLDGGLGVFMVAPAAMLALSGGYLFGYWASVLAKYDPWQPLLLRVSRGMLRALVLPTIVLLVGVSTGRNIRNFGDPYLKELNEVAGEMAEELGGDGFYAGRSGFNEVLRLALRERGVACEVLDMDPALWRRAAYREIISARFEGEDARLASMARVGPGPFLQTWMSRDPDFSERVLLGEYPELPRRVGLRALPTVHGYRAVSGMSVEELRKNAEAFPARAYGPEVWRRVEETGRRDRGVAALAEFLGGESRRANHLGYLLEGEGEGEVAFRMYRHARDLRPDNVSALLNLAMRREQLPESERARVDEEMEEFLGELGDGRLDSERLWRLSAHYGYIRHPQLLMERGWAWVVSGQPRMAVPDLEEVIRGGAGGVGVRLRLAHALFAGRDLDGSEVEYARILEENPESGRALLGLARITGMRGEVDEALGYLDRMREQGVGEEVLRREELAVLLVGGRIAEAEERAEAWLREAPRDGHAVLSRIVVAEAAGDTEVVLELTERLARMEELGPGERLMLARLHVQAGSEVAARRQLRSLLAGRAMRREAMELLLSLEVRSRDREATEKLVNALLTLDPEHAYANHILGTLLLAEGNTAGGISALETSIASGPSAAALNDLAYTLHLQGENARALELVEQAVELNPASPHAQGTLAAVLLAKGRVEEAAAAIRRALALAPDHPPFLVMLGEVYHAQGRSEEALELARRLRRMEERLAPPTRERVRELLEVLRRAP